MHPSMIWAIFRKDLRDAIRDSRVLVALLVPLGIGIFYNLSFDDTTPTPEAEVVYYAAENSQLPEAIQTVVADTVQLSFRQASSADEVRQQVVDEDADIGLVLSSGFDAAVGDGAQPSITVVLPESPSFGGDYVAASLEPALRQMAGQQPPAVLNVDRVSAEESVSESIFDQLGLRRYFVLVALVMLIGMISMLAVPIILTEEVEKKTLDALVMIASYLDVVIAKALVGLAYIAVAVPLQLVLTQISPAELVLFAAAVLALSLVLVGFGLLVGGVFRNANQVNTWGGVILLPLIAPAFMVGLPLPDWVDKILMGIPTSQATRVLVNAVGGEDFFANTWLAFVVMAVWGVVAYGLLSRRLASQEA